MRIFGEDVKFECIFSAGAWYPTRTRRSAYVKQGCIPHNIYPEKVVVRFGNNVQWEIPFRASLHHKYDFILIIFKREYSYSPLN